MDAALSGRDPASITKVRLSNKSYSPGAAAVIGEALKEMTSVTEVIRFVHLNFNQQQLVASAINPPTHQ